MKHFVKLAFALLLPPCLQADVMEHQVSVQLKMHVEETPYTAGNSSIKKITPYTVTTADILEHLCAIHGKPFTKTSRLIRKNQLDEDGNVLSHGYFIRDKFESDIDVSGWISWNIPLLLTKSRINTVTKVGNFSDIQLQTFSFNLNKPRSEEGVPFYMNLTGYATSQGRSYAPPLKKDMRVLHYSETFVCWGAAALDLKKFTSTDTYSFIEGTIRHNAPRFVRVTNAESN